MTTRYHHWTIEYNPKPTADRRWDYDVVHDDYDLDSDLAFSADSIRTAIEEIKMREEEDNG